MKISFGDNVRVISSSETEKRGLAGKKGQVYGETTPSVTGVEVIGQTSEDYAINVHFEDLGEGYWFSEALLEFVDHAGGTEVSVGEQRAVRQSDGTWKKSAVGTSKKWWQFWKSQE